MILCRVEKPLFVRCVFLVMTMNLYSQDSSSHNADFFYRGSTIDFLYNLEDVDSIGEYYTRCEVFNNDNSMVFAYAMSGDTRFIGGSSHKVIKWDFLSDRFDTSNSSNRLIHAKLWTTKIPQLNKRKLLWKSTVFPGSGMYVLTKNKFHLLHTVMGYSALGIGFAMGIDYAYRSHKTKIKYEETPYPYLFYKAKKQRTLSRVYFASGLSIWAINQTVNYVMLLTKLVSIKLGFVDTHVFGQEYQSHHSQSFAKPYYATVAFKKPQIEIPSNSICLIDSSGNDSVEFQEKDTLTMRITNTGEGNAYDVVVKVLENKATQKIHLKRTTVVGDIASHTYSDVRIPMSAFRGTPSGSVDLFFTVTESNKFGIASVHCRVNTKGQ